LNGDTKISGKLERKIRKNIKPRIVGFCLNVDRSPDSTAGDSILAPFGAAKEEPSSQSRKRLDAEESHQLARIVPAPSQITQIAAEATIWYNRSWCLSDVCDVDQLAVAGRDLPSGVEEPYVAVIVEIGDRAHTPCSGPPETHNFEIGVNVFEHFGTHDRVVIAGVALGVQRVADSKQLGKPSAEARVVSGYRAEIETAVSASILSQQHPREKSAAASDFENRSTSVLQNAGNNLSEQGSVPPGSHLIIGVRVHAIVEI
jgi:hypothetical protein